MYFIEELATRLLSKDQWLTKTQFTVKGLAWSTIWPTVTWDPLRPNTLWSFSETPCREIMLMPLRF